MRPLLNSFVEKLKNKKEVEAILFMGGLANSPFRNFLDEYSDLDMSIFISIPNIEKDILKKCFQISPYHPIIQNYLPKWLPNFEFHLKTRFRIPME